MKMFLILLVGLASWVSSQAQTITSTLYKGTINNRAVTLYVKQEPNPCGGATGSLYQGIYKYGNGKAWIELEIASNGKGNFCLTEFNFTGLLILRQNGNRMEGIWISPDGKTQLKVALEKQPLTAKQREEMEVNLERTHYSNHDC
jgi:hypothetical protein